MKKILHLVLFVSIGFSTSAQVIFNETFDRVPGSISGGQGTYAFPAGWLLRNVDNRTPYPTVNYVNDAWERREDFLFNVNDSCAFSTSYYNPVGAADDWMWTPPITITGCNPVLSWNSVAYDPAYPDGYEVRVMVAPNEPTGGPGDIGNQVSNSALLYSIAAANTAWTNNQVNLSSYIGQTVRIAFRNYSNDQFLLAIDDVKVENVFTVLAVNNFSLVGKSVYGTNKLNWKNEEILNMPYSYDLERSIDQRSWESIYPIQSTGRANTATFNYEDVQIKNKICYYRVKVRTELNKIYYSNVVRLSNENSNSDIRIYPNPVVNDLQVDMADYANKTIIITDVMGKKVLAKKLTNTHSVFSISNLPPGTYQVNVVEGTRSVYVSKIVLVK